MDGFLTIKYFYLLNMTTTTSKTFYARNHIFCPATKQECTLIPVTGKNLILTQPTVTQMMSQSGDTLTANATGINPSVTNYVINTGDQTTPGNQYINPSINSTGAINVTTLTGNLTVPYFSIQGSSPTSVPYNTIAFPSGVFNTTITTPDYFNNISFNLSTGTLTFANPGFYTIYCSVNWAAANDTTKTIYMYLNGSSSYSNFLSYITNNGEGSYAKNYQTMSKYYFSTSNNTITIIPTHQFATPINLNDMVITAYQC